MKAIALAAASLAAVALLAGCASKETQAQKDNSKFTYLLDRASNWTENKNVPLPPMPADSDLLPFDVSANTPLQYFVDAKSISVGSDSIIRFTAVITSPSGARNVYYEGIHCDNYTWRQYAGLNDTHDGWDPTVATDWTRIEGGELNAYQATLFNDFMCDNRTPAGKASEIVKNIRLGRTIQSQQPH